MAERITVVGMPGNDVPQDADLYAGGRRHLDTWAPSGPAIIIGSDLDAALDAIEATPGTVVYDSGAVPISRTSKGALVSQDFSLNAAVPLQGALPSTFTWTIRFSGLGSQDAAGLGLRSVRCMA